MKVFLAAIALTFFSTTAQAYPPEVSSVDIATQISVVTHQDADDARAFAIDAIWHTPSLDVNLMPVVTIDDYPKTNYQTPNLAKITIYETTIAFGAKMNVVAFFPINWRTGRPGLIIHGGHGQNAAVEVYLIKKAIEAGFMVVTVNMLLAPANANPLIIDTPRGKMNFANHDSFGVLFDPAGFNPLEMFLDPALSAVNLLKSYNVGKIAMTGVSGGGWTATLMGAVDTRIDAIYPIDGSYPIYARGWDVPQTYADFEQHLPGLLDRIGYLDLYLMAAQNRRHIAYWIQNDTCCFNGDIPSHFMPPATIRAQSLNGVFLAYYDNSTGVHEITNWAADHMMADFLANVAD